MKAGFRYEEIIDFALGLDLNRKHKNADRRHETIKIPRSTTRIAANPGVDMQIKPS